MSGRCGLSLGIGVLALTAGCMPFGWLDATPGEPLPAPFVLDAAEEAELSALFAAWDRQHAGLATLSCRFIRWQYDPIFSNKVGPSSIDEGSLKYAAPEKVAFRVTGGAPEHWTCDGKSVYGYDYQKRQLIQYDLPPQLRGRAIGHGPLPTPFVFAATSRQLRQRYYVRIVTPADDAKTVWLEFLPRFKRDAAIFQRAEMILEESKAQPLALQVHAPGGRRTVYAFQEIVCGEPIDAAAFGPPH